MPIYGYVCDRCHTEQEHYRSMADRDKPMLCTLGEVRPPEKSECGGNLVRPGVDLPTVGTASYQPGVILGNGSKLKGSFKTARKQKGWHRP